MSERYNNLLSLLSQQSNSITMELYKKYGSMFNSYEEFRQSIHKNIDNFQVQIFEADPEEIIDEMKNKDGKT